MNSYIIHYTCIYLKREVRNRYMHLHGRKLQWLWGSFGERCKRIFRRVRTSFEKVYPYLKSSVYNYCYIRWSYRVRYLLVSRIMYFIYENKKMWHIEETLTFPLKKVVLDMHLVKLCIMYAMIISKIYWWFRKKNSIS